MPMSFIPVTLSSLSHPTLTTKWEVPYHQLNAKEKCWASFTNDSLHMRVPPISGWWQHRVKEILPEDRTLNSAPGCSFCMEEEMARGATALGYSQWFILGGQELGRT